MEEWRVPTKFSSERRVHVQGVLLVGHDDDELRLRVERNLAVRQLPILGVVEDAEMLEIDPARDIGQVEVRAKVRAADRNWPLVLIRDPVVEEEVGDLALG